MVLDNVPPMASNVTTVLNFIIFLDVVFRSVVHRPHPHILAAPLNFNTRNSRLSNRAASKSFQLTVPHRILFWRV